jgi:HSP20 family protein
MAIKDLVPKFRSEREQMPARRGEWDPLHEFQRDMNRLFDDFFGDFPLARRWEREAGALAPDMFSPAVDISETEKDVKVCAELPGLDEKDVTVEIDESALTIRGEKKEEKEEKGRNWYRREQSYGSFHRVVPLPASVESEKAKANFKKGVLTVTIPKRDEERASRKTIPIEAD